MKQRQNKEKARKSHKQKWLANNTILTIINGVVVLKDIGKYFTTVVIRNEQYAQEFALLNGLDPL